MDDKKFPNQPIQVDPKALPDDKKDSDLQKLLISKGILNPQKSGTANTGSLGGFPDGFNPFKSTESNQQTPPATNTPTN